MNGMWEGLFDGSVIGSPPCLHFCDENKTIVLACLPEILSELAGLSDFSEMFKLVNSCGGRKIYLPLSCHAFLAFSGVNLPDDTYHRWRRLARINGQIEVSSRWGVFLALRRAAIHLAMKNGVSSNEIIMDYGITQRQLRSLKTRYSD